MQDKWPGLTKSEAGRRLARYGPNLLERPVPYSVLKLVVAQFTSPLILVLLGAMGITLFLGDTVDSTVIGLAVLLNTILGFWQEYKAERGLEALQKVVVSNVVVVRDGVKVEVAVDQVVPGDLVRLSAGEKIPADGVVVEAQELRVNEAVLTGESVPVEKKAPGGVVEPATLGHMDTWVDDKFVGVEARQDNKVTGSVYAGTNVVRGEGLLVVKATGMETEVGKIAGALIATKEEATPLQKQLLELSKKIAVGVGLLSVILFVIGYATGVPWLEMFTVAVAVGVSAIPEGLVISLTAILAVGMQRILKRKALVRKLVAAEVLGSVSVIASDKTGTITEGVMQVKEVRAVDEELMAIAALTAAKGTDQLEEVFREWGAKTVGKGRIEKITQSHALVDRWPFTAERKFSLTLTEREAFMVGAPEIILQKVALSEKERERWLNELAEHASQGYRLVGVAHRKYQGERKVTGDLLAKRWYWLGMVVFADQVRPGLKRVLAEVGRAGIHVKIITGDFRETAEAVWRRLGVELEPEEIIDGDELSGLSSQALDRRIKQVKLFARTSPSQKLLIVNSLKRQGEVVAMTGDGVNDAPALKRADIGIVVNNATDVAKETADMVLLDSNFATIVAAVEEGRGIFKNIRKVLLYLLSDSFTEVLLVLGALLLGLPIPLTAAQILWVNLANDGLPGMALTVDPHISGLLGRPPRKPEEPLIDKEIAVLIGLISVVTAVMVLVGYVWRLSSGASVAEARTFAFALLGIDSLVYVFSSRSMRTPLWRDVPWRNPWLIGAVLFGLMMQLAAIYVPGLQRLLGTHSLDVISWVVIGGMSLVVLGMIEGVKTFFWYREQRK